MTVQSLIKGIRCNFVIYNFINLMNNQKMWYIGVLVNNNLI